MNRVSRARQGAPARRKTLPTPIVLARSRFARYTLLVSLCVIVFVVPACSAAGSQPNTPASQGLAATTGACQGPTATAGHQPLVYAEFSGGLTSEPRLVAVSADGHRLQNVDLHSPPTWIGPTWSPDGSWLAYLAADGKELNLVNLGGARKTLLEGTGHAGELFIGWHAAWSPDSQCVAAITENQQRDYAVVVASVRDGSLIWRRQIPAGTLDLPYFTGPPDKFRWSPDGRKILISWGRAVVLDTTTNRVVPISEHSVVAEWSPASDAVYFFDIVNQDTPHRTLGAFSVRQLDASVATQLVDQQSVTALGMTLSAPLYGLMTLAPDGSRLAMVTGHTAITIFELHGSATPLALDKAGQRIETTDQIVALEWDPSGRYLAAVAISDKVYVKILDVAAGTWATVGVMFSSALQGPDSDVFVNKLLTWTQ